MSDATQPQAAPMIVTEDNAVRCGDFSGYVYQLRRGGAWSFYWTSPSENATGGTFPSAAAALASLQAAGIDYWSTYEQPAPVDDSGNGGGQ